jgi:hypothetical protein
MCSQGAGAPLADVYLRGTLLSGPVDKAFQHCAELVSLNLQVGAPGRQTVPGRRRMRSDHRNRSSLGVELGCQTRPP